MNNLTEVLVTSDASSTVWSCCIWNYKTGVALHTYRGGIVPSPNTISFIKNDYVITAERLKPLLHVWPINSQETLKNCRFVCPGKVSTLAVTPEGSYCIAGIDEKLYVWQIATGRLLAIGAKHFQFITKIVISGDGTHVVSAGEDGLVILWSLAQLLSKQPDDTEPVWTASDHSMPVTDLCLGGSGLDANLVTVSADRTLKLYHLISGNLLLSVVFETSLTAVAMNSSESSLYVGTIDGPIYEMSLLNPPRTREYHIPQSKAPVFEGHTKAITCLSVSIDGCSLVSGAQDEQVIIWHIPTKQKLRSLLHKAAVTNAFFTIPHANMFASQHKPITVLNSFQPTLADDDEDEVVEVIHLVDQHLPFTTDDKAGNIVHQPLVKSDDKDLASEVEKLKTINAKLYKFMLDKIMQNNFNISDTSSNDSPIKRKRKAT